jgi:hypothetical protein
MRIIDATYLLYVYKKDDTGDRMLATHLGCFFNYSAAI